MYADPPFPLATALNLWTEEASLADGDFRQIAAGQTSI